MKTGNTLRMAKNSLLCFFMTLAGGFLVACGSSSDGSGVARPSAPLLSSVNRNDLLPHFPRIWSIRRWKACLFLAPRAMA